MDGMTSSPKADTIKEASSSAVDAAKGLSSTAMDEAKGVAHTAKEEARVIVKDAREQTMHLLDEVRTQAKDQAEHQAERLADTVAQLADKVRALIEGRPEEAGAIKDQLQKAADGLESVSRSVRERGAQGLIDGVSDLGRRKPGLFLAGAALAGFGISRIARAGSANGNGSMNASDQPPAFETATPTDSRPPISLDEAAMPSPIGTAASVPPVADPRVL